MYSKLRLGFNYQATITNKKTGGFVLYVLRVETLLKSVLLANDIGQKYMCYTGLILSFRPWMMVSCNCISCFVKETDNNSL